MSEAYRTAVLNDLIRINKSEELSFELMNDFYDTAISVWAMELNSEHLALEIINLDRMSKR